jgi:multidrug efflux pump
MNISRFFITRPIFAGVLSLLIFILGTISLFQLPISEYPEVAPPTVIVTATYPGANPKTIAETVASPLEQTINGIENMLYMSSQSTANGVMTLTVTFKIGTELDLAQMQVQNRVSQVLPKLPEEVRRFGVTTVKSSPNMTLVVHLLSPNERYDEIYLRNYATLNVKDELTRLAGVGQVNIFGGGDYAMRVWIDPDKAAARGLTSGDIVNAIREQNIQVAAGTIGQQPTKDASFELTVNAKGRLISEEEFDQIIVKIGAHGEKLRLRDVARAEMGSGDYSLRALLNNKRAVGMGVFQLPGANALAVSQAVRSCMTELKKKMPEGVDYAIAYDPTVFVEKSIDAVIHTLIEALLLVVLVVVLFLQTWRASIIPLAAVPVSLVGTFAVMHALGFSINNLSLFGLVLAIGIVVDDAIVVVENVERNIQNGLKPLAATQQAMTEVTGPIVATALVLCAVFIPTAFISGLTGQFYKQFAVTIAISTVISAINSLTLSPALSALLLKGHGDKRDILTKIIDALFGWFFRPFNRFFEWSSNVYVGIVKRIIRFSAIAVIIYGGLVWATWKGFEIVPEGFVPGQDKQYLVGFAQLPDGASLDRTDDVMRRMSQIAMDHPGVKDAIAFPGLSIQGFTISPNAGIVFVGLDNFEDRTTPELSGAAIAGALNGKFMAIQDAMVFMLTPPPVNGIGTTGGFKLMVEDRGNLGYAELYKATQALAGAAMGSGKFIPPVFSGYTVNVPQIEADVDREKAKIQGVPLANLFETLQVNLGSLYVNDFNRFGRTYQVVAQAEQQFRDEASDITRLKTRNAVGDMVSVGSLVKVKEGFGPDRVTHYNGYLAADINGAAMPPLSSGQGEEIMAKLAKDGLPGGFEFEWTDLTYQKIIAGNTAIYIYPLCILLVFMVLAAQYESLRLPLAIILIVPLCLLFALAGVMITGGDNNIFTQIGFIVLIGLACKNAILIVEFAKERFDHGLTAFDAAIEACRLRLRPILMTSIAFIAGVYPLVVSTGAGAEMRRAMGTAVFAGMIGVTFLGLFFTPVFYVLAMLGHKKKTTAPATTLPAPH